MRQVRETTCRFCRPSGWVWRRRVAGVSVAAMTGSGSGAPKQTRFDPPLSDIRTRQMGELMRGESRWDVLLETVRDGSVDAVRGRIHFVSGNIHRISAWIFLDWTEREVQERFAEYSSGPVGAQQLWDLVNSLEGGEKR